MIERCTNKKKRKNKKYRKSFQMFQILDQFPFDSNKN